MNEKQKLKFHGGIGMSLIPVAIYIFFCMVLFIGFKAFNMEALAVGGFLALLIGGVFCTSYNEFWESAIKGISSITSVSVVVILLLVGMFSALIKQCGLSGRYRRRSLQPYQVFGGCRRDHPRDLCSFRRDRWRV